MATDLETSTAPALSDEGDAAPKGIYDRSSLTGDYMVVLEGQTSEDFELYAPEGRFCDYLEGKVYMPSPVTDRHQEQLGFIFVLFDGFREERGDWRVLMGPAVLRIDDEHKPEPDIFVVPAHAAGGAEVIARAVLVIEILSPSTRSHDLHRKLKAYQDAGIPEIWFLDDRDKQLIAECRQDDGYHREVYETGPIASSAIPGFWLDVDWLWADPLPGPRRCVNLILAGPPA